MLQGLRTVGFVVRDLAAAKDWYTSVVGHGPYFDEPFYVGFDVGGYELGLMPEGSEGEVRPGVGGAVTDWAVDDVPAALERLIALGATALMPAQEVGGGIVVGAVTDPFGNALGVITNPHFAPPLVAAGVGDVSERAIVREIVVPAPPEEAFALWASSEGMAKWWVPSTRIELRPGGFYELYFMTDAPKGQQGSEGCRVLSFLPGRMLSFTWNAPPHLPKTRSRRTWVVVETTPEGAGTRLRLTHLGWPDSEWDTPGSQWPETFAYFDKAWTSVVDLFAKHFTGG